MARAVKDFDRRSDEERKGFEYTPPDCLALKYYRDVSALSFPPVIRQTLQAPSDMEITPRGSAGS